MKPLLTLCCLVLSLGLSAQDFDYAARTIPSDLKKDANSVVRYHEIIYRAESAKAATVFERKIITILNDQHNRENQLVIYYDNNVKVSKVKATLYDAEGERIRSAKKSEIEDVRALSGGQFYTDSRVLTTTLDHQSYPFTVEFEYEKKLTDFGMVGFPRWLPLTYDQSVQFSSYTAHVPTEQKLIHQRNMLPEPVMRTDGTNRVYAWQVADLPARQYEAYAPPMSKTMPFLRIGLENFEIGDYNCSYENWKSYGNTMAKLMAGRDQLPASLATLVREKTAGLTTDREKIDVLYHLLQERTRYVGVQLGVGGWQPFSAEYVETNRFGDCKALSNYMGAMLSEVGVPSYPVLVDWNDVSFLPVDESFTSPAFNHMILYVPSEDMYLECTSSTSPTGYLGEGKDDRNVLWITPDGGQLARTPKLQASDNGHLRRLNITVQEDGTSGFDLDGRFFGMSQERLRRFAHSEQDVTKQQETLNKWEHLPDVGGKFSFSYDLNSPVVNLTYETTLPSYVRKLGKRIFVPINKFYAYDYVPEKLEERKFPIFDNDASFRVDTINLTFPDGLEVESMGEKLTEFKHAAGEYRSELTSTPGKITWVRTLKLLPVELPATEYEEYRQFFVDVRKAEKRQVVLRAKRTK